MKTKTVEFAHWPIAPVNPVDDFFEKLGQTPRTWFLERDGAIRCRDTDWRLWCPVSAATGVRADFTSPSHAARTRLGIDKATSRTIGPAADHYGTIRQAMRARLLEATGLEERHGS